MSAADAIAAAVDAARRRLADHGYRCDVSAEDLQADLGRETRQRDPPPEAVLENPYLVVHALWELRELHRMGHRPTEASLPANDPVRLWAHLRAAEVEVEVAKAAGALDHLRRRLEDLRTGSSDPALPPRLRERTGRLAEGIETFLATSAEG